MIRLIGIAHLAVLRMVQDLSFNNLCAYSAMYESVGTVDHYFCCKNYRHLAYEWGNYRFVSGWLLSIIVVQIFKLGAF